jgi:hypothetical protein
MQKILPKTVSLDLAGVPENAYCVLGVFSRQARREQWTESEIASVIHEAKQGDYDHLLATILSYCD